jgi:hypothetical protein
LALQLEATVQTQFLKRFAPDSLYLLYHPADTGNPNYDLNTHLEKFANRFINDPKNNRKYYSGNITRIDLESTQLVGDRVLGRVEIDLGSPDETEQHKILSIPYALKQLANLDNAKEFVRVIKHAVCAGVEPDPRSLQIWASWAYDEIKNRYAKVSHNTSHDAQALAEFKATIIQQVLTELAVFARTLTAITATNEDRQFEEPKVVDRSPREVKLSPAERRDLFEQRYDDVMCIEDPLSPFAAELRSICSKISRAHASGVLYDDEAQFQSHLTGLADSGQYSDEHLEKLQDAHERVTEQYSEDGVVSLHMSDGERFVVDGTLEEDVTEEYLPLSARAIATDLHTLFCDGEDLETIERFIELSLNRIYGDPTDSAERVSRTARGIKIKQAPTRQHPDGTCHQSKPVRTRNWLFQYTYTVSVYRNREERQYVREVLDILLANMQRDFILRSMNRSKAFRTFHNQIANASDLRALIEVIKEAYQARSRKAINIKMFTALNTLYVCKRANLESTAMRITQETDGQLRTFMPAVPVIAIAKQIAVPDLQQLALKLHTLPAQEQERVRKVFREERPKVYRRIVDGLTTRIRTASQGKRMYFRFAFYVHLETGIPNEPLSMFHLLTAADRAVMWQKLKASTGVDQPTHKRTHSLPQSPGRQSSCDSSLASTQPVAH